MDGRWPAVPDPADCWSERAGGLERALSRLVDGADAVSLPVLPPGASRRLMPDLWQTAARRATPSAGQPGREVRQSFHVADRPPPPLRALARRVNERINAASRRLLPRPFPRVVFNEQRLQLYPTGPEGISPHRDHRHYHYLVAVVVLAGEGRFIVCADRAGRAAREVPAPAGWLVLLRAPGFGGSNRRPFHAVLDIARPRAMLGLRHDSRLIAG